MDKKKPSSHDVQSTSKASFKEATTKKDELIEDEMELMPLSSLNYLSILDSNTVSTIVQFNKRL